MDYHKGYLAGQHKKRLTAAVRLGRVARLLDQQRPASLDVGCSLGYTVETASRLGWDAHGVDLHPQVVEFCRRRGLRCQVTEDGILPYPDESFHVLTAWHVLEHVADVSQALAEWARVLKPRGVLALETPDSSCAKVRLRAGRYGSFWARNHVYAFNRQNLASLLESAGFEVVRRPLLAKLSLRRPRLAAYAIAYQCLKELQMRTRLYKAFEMFCRRKSRLAQPVRFRQGPADSSRSL